jgi:hypothetical protein
MKITRRQLRRIIKEEMQIILISPPTSSDELHPCDVQPVEDVWSGGDNLEDPINWADVVSGESNAGPHFDLSNSMMLREQDGDAQETTLQVGVKGIEQVLTILGSIEGQINNLSTNLSQVGEAVNTILKQTPAPTPVAAPAPEATA